MHSKFPTDIEKLISDNILEINPNSIIAVDMKGNVMYWNRGAERIFGYLKEEILGKSLKLIYPDFNESFLFSDFEEIKKRVNIIGEWQGRNKSGASVWVDLNTNILTDTQDNIIGFIGISKDITSKRELQLYKSKLSSIVEFSDDGIESMNLDGTILSWNKGAENIYGYTAKEIVGKNALILYPDQIKDELNNNLEIIRKGKSIKGIETKRIRKDGAIIFISLTLSALLDDKSEVYGISAITRDITEQRQTVKELIESEIRYQTIFENSGEGFLLMNDTILACNKKFCDIFGYAKKEIIGKTLGFFSPEYQRDGILSVEKAQTYIQKAFAEGNTSFYWQHKTKKSEIIETKVSLNRIRVSGEYQIIAVVHDFTELFKYQTELKEKTDELLGQNTEILKLNQKLTDTNKQLVSVNEKIEQSERKFRIAFKTSPDSININRLKDGLYVEINSGFTQLTGYSEKDVIGKTSADISIWVNRSDRDILTARLVKDGYVANLEAEFRAKNGSVTTGLMSASIIELDGEDHIISITRDIAERKDMENVLLQAIEKAEESDRLKSAFLANMSHEIRTPMNAILGFSQLLKEKELDKEKRNQFLDIINSRSKNLLQIINDIIDISKIEANQLNLELRDFSLNKVLHDIFSSFELELLTEEKELLKLELLNSLGKKSIIIKSDELRLRQILSNLISNAIKFTEKGKIELSCKLKGSLLEFFVSDTGIGIKPDSQMHIFDRFRQADDSNTREFGGTGLGLSISKQLVEMLGGNIWVESELNKGSVFYFTIPYVPMNESPNEKDKPLNEVLDLKGKTVLIVEDDFISTVYLEELLSSTNAKIVKAENGLQAVNLFKEKNEIDIILMDVHMPIMNGNDATREIKKINNSIPIIMQSAFAMPSDKEKSILYGCDDYVTKPIDPKLLFSTIKKHLFI